MWICVWSIVFCVLLLWFSNILLYVSLMCHLLYFSVVSTFVYLQKNHQRSAKLSLFRFKPSTRYCISTRVSGEPITDLSQSFLFSCDKHLLYEVIQWCWYVWEVHQNVTAVMFSICQKGQGVCIQGPVLRNVNMSWAWRSQTHR